MASAAMSWSQAAAVMQVRAGCAHPGARRGRAGASAGTGGRADAGCRSSRGASRGAEGQGRHLLVADRQAGQVGTRVEFGADAQPGGMVVEAMVATMTAWLVSRLPRQFMVM